MARLINLGTLCVFMVLVSACAGEHESPGRSQIRDEVADGEVTSADWIPEHPIEHRTYTEEERLAWRDEFLAYRAQSEGLANPPEVELVRWTTSLQDMDQALVTCLTESGFPAEMGWDGGVMYTPPVPPDQDQALQLASYVCFARYMPIPSIMSDWTDDMLGMVWDYWTEAYVPCLEANGISGMAEPPTRDFYVENFYDDIPGSWMPFQQLANAPISEAERARIAGLCPTYPPAQYFYGS